MKTINPMLLSDSYKQSHEKMYPEGITKLYSNLTPRKSRINGIDEVVVFGIQFFIKEFLIRRFNEDFFNRPLDEVVEEYSRIIDNHLGKGNISTQKVIDLHNLGYLPLLVKALPEGESCPIKVPMCTITNTHPNFAWLTNFVETIFSTSVWQGITSATIAKQYRSILDEYAIETVGNTDFVQWQGHCFAMRGMSSLETSMISDAGHLLSFTGSDTIPTIPWLETYYNADCEKELISGSVAASEHSISCSYGQENEGEMFRHLLEDVYPNGIISIVSDSWNLWTVLTDILPSLHDVIMNRKGTLTIRPDSGDPVEIICGTYIPDLTNEEYCTSLNKCDDWMEEEIVEKIREGTPHGEMGESKVVSLYKWRGTYYRVVVEIDWNRHDKQYYYIDGHRLLSSCVIQPSPEQLGVVELLWNEFGGVVNEKGFKVLDSHVLSIYGDSITLERAREICRRLMLKGFASTNVVLGIGSYTYNYVTRDTFGMAMKATYCEVNGEGREIFKNPVTDSDSMKKSLKGLIKVEKVNGKYIAKDQQSFQDEQSGELKDIFKDGVLLVDHNLSDIRKRVGVLK